MDGGIPNVSFAFFSKQAIRKRDARMSGGPPPLRPGIPFRSAAFSSGPIWFQPGPVGRRAKGPGKGWRRAVGWERFLGASKVGKRGLKGDLTIFFFFRRFPGTGRDSNFCFRFFPIQKPGPPKWGWGSEACLVEGSGRPEGLPAPILQPPGPQKNPPDSPSTFRGGPGMARLGWTDVFVSWTIGGSDGPVYFWGPFLALALGPFKIPNEGRAGGPSAAGGAPRAKG